MWSPDRMSRLPGENRTAGWRPWRSSGAGRLPRRGTAWVSRPLDFRRTPSPCWRQARSLPSPPRSAWLGQLSRRPRYGRKRLCAIFWLHDPYPLVGLNHFTIPIATSNSPKLHGTCLDSLVLASSVMMTSPVDEAGHSLRRRVMAWNSPATGTLGPAKWSRFRDNRGGMPSCRNDRRRIMARVTQPAQPSKDSIAPHP